MIFEKSHFQIVAHRGVHNECPENTFEAFERAIELGADAVELDVRLTSDHVPIIFHWFYFDVVTTLQGAPFDYTFEQLKRFDFLEKWRLRKKRSNPNPAPGSGKIGWTHRFGD